ncbi:MAG: aminomethyl-transferring glycine dehydrogenase subunit GcvPA [SAR202 cluster bacterium]|nr:aminomethyl-transferring glycine dehydrogenase subunit GcvPA [SAR202 cluster bacterium]
MNTHEDLGYISPYIPNTDLDRKNMLNKIGVSSIDELFKDIPDKYRNPNLNLTKPLSEFELKKYIDEICSMNIVPGDYSCFLGGGSYQHHIPAIVNQLSTRSEYMTSYTPYQPEVSQGTLQTEYEFQSLCCLLTNMEVANAGMYDGSTSLAEAALMSARINKKSKIAILNTVSPTYIEILKTYTQYQGLSIYMIEENQTKLEDDTTCLIVQNPNFYGNIDDMNKFADIAHKHEALLVAYTDAMSLGMFIPPGDYDADIAVAEGQTLGVPTSFGGPYVGIFTCKKKYIRQMPGRIVGATEDTKGNTAYVLTLQTREQHIRRENATSNICTSVALIALMSTIYMASLGKSGIKHIAELCYQKAHYASNLINKIPGYSLLSDKVFFREFGIICPRPPKEINKILLEKKIIGGLDISDKVENGMLISITELNSKEEIDLLVSALSEIK